MITLLENLCIAHPEWNAQKMELETAPTLVSIVSIAWFIGIQVARLIVQQELARRAIEPTQWPDCPNCGAHLHSKGFEERRIVTLVGEVKWSRRVGRCRHSCHGSQRIPLDQSLGISAYQETSTEVIRLGCLLAVFVPFETTAWLLKQLTGVNVCAQTIGNWVETIGKRAMEKLATQMTAFAKGDSPEPEPIEDAIAQMTLAIAADGVMVPFRPQEKTPKGKTLWREVKVGVLARLGQHLTRAGKTVTRLRQRRLVAVLGDIHSLRSQLMLEAIRQGLHTASKVVWLSDGGRGFWNLYTQCLAQLGVVGVLDFYHAAGHLWQAAGAYLDGRTRAARNWFKHWRHQLRHGNSAGVISELNDLMKSRSLSVAVRQTLRLVNDYFKAHENHIDYQGFEASGIPRGSGMVESACKWLIQQRFKGAGMRWSEDGFNYLLHLRLAVVNGRFDELFLKGDFSLPSVSSPKA